MSDLNSENLLLENLKKQVENLENENSLLKAKIEELNASSMQANDTNKQNIFKNISFNGELCSDEDVILQGKIKGDIVGARNIQVDADSRLEGNIKGGSATVAGSVYGDINVKETIEILKTGTVCGNIFTKQLFVESGGILDGNSHMSSDFKKSMLGNLNSSDDRTKKQAEVIEDVEAIINNPTESDTDNFSAKEKGVRDTDDLNNIIDNAFSFDSTTKAQKDKNFIKNDNSTKISILPKSEINKDLDAEEKIVDFIANQLSFGKK